MPRVSHGLIRGAAALNLNLVPSTFQVCVNPVLRFWRQGHTTVKKVDRRNKKGRDFKIRTGTTTPISELSSTCHICFVSLHPFVAAKSRCIYFSNSSISPRQNL